MSLDSTALPSQPQSHPHPQPTTLILVCCHAIFIGSPFQSPSSPSPHSSSQPDPLFNPTDPTQWLLQPFQATEAPTFIQHVQTGLDLLRADPTSILVFSGGRTRSGQGCQVSEAEGYARVAEWALANGGSVEFDGDRNGSEVDRDVQKCMGRVFLEDYATDSFQNVLFALLGWKVWTHQREQQEQQPSPLIPAPNHSEIDFPTLPRKIIIVSHAFKRARFMKLHVPTIRDLLSGKARQAFDGMGVEYVGIDPPFSVEERKGVEEGERVRGYEPWVGDRFGVGEVLGGKRRGRGWDGGREYLEWWRGRMGMIGVAEEKAEPMIVEVERIVSGG